MTQPHAAQRATALLRPEVACNNSTGLPSTVQPPVLPTALLVLLLTGHIMGCTTPPPPDRAAAPTGAPLPPAAQAVQDPASRWRLRLQERARESEAAGKLPQALLHWQGLQLLDPDDQEAGQQARRLSQLLDQSRRTHEQRANEALRRSDTDAAEHHFAQLLALQPGHQRALQALRQIELQKLRRQPAAPFTLPPAPTMKP